MIIAMDGPAGAGKSTVAKLVASELGIPFLDTGAMYRAVTLAVLERDIHPSDAEACSHVARELDIRFAPDGEVQVDGVSVEPDIRTRTVTLNVSAVSAHPGVREAIVADQREIAERVGSLVAEGRDTTTIVFPNAQHKFFLDATPRERALRRALQEKAPERLDQILHDIERRDRLDTTRAHSPLVRAPEAVLIEVDALSVEEVVGQILEHVRGSG